MSDLSGKTITIPADLGFGLVYADWTPAALRRQAEALEGAAKFAPATLLRCLAGAIEEQHPPRMDEPVYGERVTAIVGARAGMFVRVVLPGGWNSQREWINVRTGLRYRWSELVNPRPVDAES